VLWLALVEGVCVVRRVGESRLLFLVVLVGVGGWCGRWHYEFWYNASA